MPRAFSRLQFFVSFWKENDLKWNSESDPTADVDLLLDKRSISSEANSAGVFSDEAHEIFARQQQNQILWDLDEVKETLTESPGGKHVVDMVQSGCFLGEYLTARYLTYPRLTPT